MDACLANTMKESEVQSNKCKKIVPYKEDHWSTKFESCFYDEIDAIYNVVSILPTYFSFQLE